MHIHHYANKKRTWKRVIKRLFSLVSYAEHNILFPSFIYMFLRGKYALCAISIVETIDIYSLS